MTGVQTCALPISKQVPAENGGEGEEEQCNGNKCGAKLAAHDAAECGLSQICFANGLGDSAGITACQNAVGGVEGGYLWKQCER